MVFDKLLHAFEGLTPFIDQLLKAFKTPLKAFKDL
jgi:hypothetical protein